MVVGFKIIAIFFSRLGLINIASQPNRSLSESVSFGERFLLRLRTISCWRSKICSEANLRMPPFVHKREQRRYCHDHKL